MSFVRSYLPESVNNNTMYYLGQTRCYLQQYFNNTFTANNITDNIFVGNMASASNKEEMKKKGITHILSVFNGAFALYPENFTYKIIHINDDPWVDIGKCIDESNAFIDEALINPSNKIMIHCKQGVSRSVTLLLAYLLYKLNVTKPIPLHDVDKVISDVLVYVQERRSVACPNKGFIECLKRYVYELNNYPTTVE
jgi:protein-tyrosine phosphatase